MRFSNFVSVPRLLLLLLAAAAPSAAGAASAARAHDPHGLWLRPDGGERFSFYDCDGLLCARLVSVKKDEDQSSVGVVILSGAKKTGANEWRGKLFNAEDGKTYDGFITVTSANELTLKGCLWGVLCSGETWTRIAAPVEASAAKPQTSSVVKPQAAPARTQAGQSHAMIADPRQ